MSRTKRYKGQAKQFYWEETMKVPFENLIQDYDTTLTTNQAIKKLILWAIAEHWLPGYIRRDKPETLQNKVAAELQKLRPDRTMIKG